MDDRTVAPGGAPSHHSWVGRRLGPYEVEAELSRGGQAAILQGRHTHLGRRVALKVTLEPEARTRARFLQEAQVLSRLDHDNLPTVFDVGEAGGAAYMALELIEGEDVKAKIRRGIPEFAWTVDVVRQVAEALHYCHQHGVIHRDLKPANVMIEAKSGRPVLVDFGLLKRDPTAQSGLSISEGEKLSQTGEAMGTPSYMAPEQVDASFGPTSTATDVYGLGATLYCLLTGSPPFEGATSYGPLNMIGNVWEWTADGYAEYFAGDQVDPKGPPVFQDGHVIRGGGWTRDRSQATATTRSHWEGRSTGTGFRVARSPR